MCWRGCGERGTLLHYWWECTLVQPLWKTVWRFLKKLIVELPYDSTIALLGIYSKDTDVVKRRAICTPMFIAAMATVAKLWKEPRCPSMDGWIRKMWSIYTMEYYASIRKDEYPTFVSTKFCSRKFCSKNIVAIQICSRISKFCSNMDRTGRDYVE